MSKLLEKQTKLKKVLADKQKAEKIAKKGEEAKQALVKQRIEVTKLQKEILVSNHTHEKATTDVATQIINSNNKESKKKVRVILIVEDSEAIKEKVTAHKEESMVGEKGGQIVIEADQLDSAELGEFKKLLNSVAVINDARYKTVLHQLKLNQGIDKLDSFESFYKPIEE